MITNPSLGGHYSNQTSQVPMDFSFFTYNAEPYISYARCHEETWNSWLVGDFFLHI